MSANIFTRFRCNFIDVHHLSMAQENDYGVNLHIKQQRKCTVVDRTIKVTVSLEDYNHWAFISYWPGIKASSNGSDGSRQSDWSKHILFRRIGLGVVLNATLPSPVPNWIIGHGASENVCMQLCHCKLYMK